MALKGSGKRRQAPAYSADAMAVRYMAGLALIALGVLIFMAVELGLSGNIFEGLRRLCFGACGIMAYVLPALPVWAGVLVIWSTQRRAPVRPWLFALLAFLGLCAFAMIISGALDYLRRQAIINTNNWGDVINNIYADSSQRMERAAGGGALGAVLAWPFWNFLGQVLGTAVIFVLTAFCLLMAMNLTPARLHDIFTGQAGVRKEQQRLERERMEQEQVAWQQQQQMAWQQQQQIIEQQQQYARQQGMSQQYMQQQPQPQEPVQQPWPQPYDGGVRDWQDQAAAGQMDATGHQSQIFGKKNTPKPAVAGRGFVSRIFGKEKKEEYDGLSDGSTLVQTARPRRTATGEPVQPRTNWKPVPEAEEVPAEKEPVRKRRNEPVQQNLFDQPEEQPARPARPEPAQPEPVGEKEPARDDSRYRRPVTEEKKPVEKPPVQPAIPVVEPIGEKTWKPPIKVPEKKKDPDEDEGPWMPTPYNFPPITDLAKPLAGVQDTRMEDEDAGPGGPCDPRPRHLPV